jgi:hypothetical protein
MSVGAKRARKSKPTANHPARRSTCFARPTSYCGSVSLNALGGRPPARVFSQVVVGEVCGIQRPGAGGQFVHSGPDSSGQAAGDQRRSLAASARTAGRAGLLASLRQVVGGYFAYHAVPTNGTALSEFRGFVLWHWLRALRRRGQRDKTTWAAINRLADRWIPRSRISHRWPSQRFAIKHPRWEPYAGVALVRFCAGGARSNARPRSRFFGQAKFLVREETRD